MIGKLENVFSNNISIINDKEKIVTQDLVDLEEVLSNCFKENIPDNYQVKQAVLLDCKKEIRKLYYELSKMEKTECIQKINQIFQHEIQMIEEESKFPHLEVEEGKLQQIEEHTEKHTVRLNPTPWLPFRSNKMDAEKAKEWIGLHPPDCRQALERLIKSIEHVTMDEFIEKLNSKVENFNNILRELEDSSYHVMVADGKSNRWLAELALSSLETLPTDVVNTNYNSYLADESKKAEPNFPKSIVLFDDGIYSGEQMTKILNMIMLDTIKVKDELEKKGLETSIPIPNLIVVPIYATEFGISKIYTADSATWRLKLNLPTDIENEAIIEQISRMEAAEIPGYLSALNPPIVINKSGDEIKEIAILHLKVKKEFHDKVKTTSYEHIKSIEEAMSEYPDDLETLTAMYWSDEDGTNSYERGAASRGNVYFDFKVPDFLSFPEALEEGKIYNKEGVKSVGEPNARGNRQPIKHPIIAETVPPYKPEFVNFAMENK